jgi:hypothetical protein
MRAPPVASILSSASRLPFGVDHVKGVQVMVPPVVTYVVLDVPALFVLTVMSAAPEFLT